MKKIFTASVFLIVIFSLTSGAHAMEVSPSIPDNVVSNANPLTVRTDNADREVARLEIRNQGDVLVFDMERDENSFYVEGVDVSEVAPGLHRFMVKRGYLSDCPEGAMFPNNRAQQVPKGWSCVYDLDEMDVFVMTDEYLYVKGQDYESPLFDIRISDISAIVEGLGSSTLSLPVNGIESESFIGEDGLEYFAVRSAADEMMIFGDLDLDGQRESISTLSNPDGTRTVRIRNVENPENRVLILWDESFLSRLGIRSVDYYFVPHQPNTRTWAESPYWYGSAHANMYYKMIKRTTWLNFFCQEKDYGDKNVFQRRARFDDNPDIGLQTWSVGNKFPIVGRIMAYRLGSQDLYTDSSHTYRVQERNQYNAAAFRGDQVDAGSLLFEAMRSDNTLEQFVTEIGE